jgi:hypothetical protein
MEFKTVSPEMRAKKYRGVHGISDFIRAELYAIPKGSSVTMQSIVDKLVVKFPHLKEKSKSGERARPGAGLYNIFYEWRKCPFIVEVDPKNKRGRIISWKE